MSHCWLVCRAGTEVFDALQDKSEEMLKVEHMRRENQERSFVRKWMGRASKGRGKNLGPQPNHAKPLAFKGLKSDENLSLGEVCEESGRLVSS